MRRDGAPGSSGWRATAVAGSSSGRTRRRSGGGLAAPAGRASPRRRRRRSRHARHHGRGGWRRSRRSTPPAGASCCTSPRPGRVRPFAHLPPVIRGAYDGRHLDCDGREHGMTMLAIGLALHGGTHAGRRLPHGSRRPDPARAAPGGADRLPPPPPPLVQLLTEDGLSARGGEPDAAAARTGGEPARDPRPAGCSVRAARWRRPSAWSWPCATATDPA